MKVENLKIGRTYFMPVKYNPKNYTCGELVEITEDKKAILVNKKGERLTVSPSKLHKRADRAVIGEKAQAHVRRQLNIQSNKPYKSLCRQFNTFIKKIDWIDLNDELKKDILFKVLQSVNLRISRLDGMKEIDRDKACEKFYNLIEQIDKSDIPLNEQFDMYKEMELELEQKRQQCIQICTNDEIKGDTKNDK